MSSPPESVAPNSIVRDLRLRAPIAKVWQAFATAEGICKWFCESATGGWAPGSMITMTWDGCDQAAMITRMEEPTLFEYRWVPGRPDGTQFADDTTTTVTFTMSEDGDETLLHLEEVGFSRLAHWRFEDNTEGWVAELADLERLFTSN